MTRPGLLQTLLGHKRMFPGRTRTVTASLLAAFCLAATAGVAAAPVVPAQDRPRGSAAPTAADRERYIQLVRKKEKLQRLNALWKVEAELSAKRTAYAVLDLSERKIYFKVRGRAFKAISFTGLEISSRSGRVDPEDLAWRAFTLVIKEGKGVETETIQRKTLTPEEAQMTGRPQEEAGEPLGAEQGAIVDGSESPDSGSGSDPSPQRMAGVAGGIIPPDPPRKYHLGFDEDMSIWVQADVSLPPGSRRYESFLAFAKALGGLFVGVTGGSSETRLIVRLPLDRGRQIYRQLLPGQRLLLTL